MKKIALQSLVLACLCAPAAAGTGWSRADDMSLYRAMQIFGAVAREQAVLCQGFAPASVASRWSRRYGVREQEVAEQLRARHGAAEVAEASRPRALREPCRPLPDGYWRIRYERLLRDLEVRMDPAFSGLAPRPVGPQR
jgi:hypothetical protein